MAFVDSGKKFDKEEHQEKMKTLMSNKDTAQYTFRIPKEMYTQVKIKLAKDGKKLRGVLLDMLLEYIKK